MGFVSRRYGGGNVGVIGQGM
ncbi:hypothetical protein Goarm_004954 [Gossypium armourianum]|uniref:Uncharacterized protein n=1 Tax=Gossypium armourianum TaxID=34283 RepID=A0A7J9JYE1_9ROSI|nr:hypothetical protein [Gossypium armourianum]